MVPSKICHNCPKHLHNYPSKICQFLSKYNTRCQAGFVICFVKQNIIMIKRLTKKYRTCKKLKSQVHLFHLIICHLQIISLLQKQIKALTYLVLLILITMISQKKVLRVQYKRLKLKMKKISSKGPQILTPLRLQYRILL